MPALYVRVFTEMARGLDNSQPAIEVCATAGKSDKTEPIRPQYIGLNHRLHFADGKPFLNFELLLKGVEIAGDESVSNLE